MKIIDPKPFEFVAGKRAVLLLHGFTGSTSDVRMLGRFLQSHDYTCYAPQYSGHGKQPEEILNYHVEDWWQDALKAYYKLRNDGYTNLAVCGLSLGGVFSLRLGYTEPVKGVIPMCAPMKFKTTDRITGGFFEFAKQYKKREGKESRQIEDEIKQLKDSELHFSDELKELLADVQNHVDQIYSPALVVQARNDDMIDINSANIIFEGIQSDQKDLIWYEHSGHVITIDDEKDKLHNDILSFLNSLQWE